MAARALPGLQGDGLTPAEGGRDGGTLESLRLPLLFPRQVQARADTPGDRFLHKRCDRDVGAPSNASETPQAR